MKKLSWILLTLPLLAGCRFEDRVPIDMASMSQSQPLGHEKSLESTIRFDIGSLEVTSGRKSTALYSFDLDYDKASYQPEVQYNAGADGRFAFDLHGTNRRGLRRQRQNNRLRLALTDSIPLSLKINAGVGDARLQSEHHRGIVFLRQLDGRLRGRATVPRRVLEPFRRRAAVPGSGGRARPLILRRRAAPE